MIASVVSSLGVVTSAQPLAVALIVCVASGVGAVVASPGGYRAIRSWLPFSMAKYASVVSPRPAGVAAADVGDVTLAT